MSRLFFLALLFCGIVVGFAPAWGQSQADTVAFQHDRLVIETQEGKRFGFNVELAITPKQQAQGLMFRRGMAPDAGMLFITDSPREISMWMKNTYIPLDMLFIDAGGTIVSIAANTTPQSLDTISSGQAIKGVLEINGGVAEQLGITTGAKVLHRAFQ
jgi:uncharacterized membrane protein (UPF0127 family)